MVPLIGPIEDFNLLADAHCRAHHKKTNRESDWFNLKASAFVGTTGLPSAIQVALLLTQETLSRLRRNGFVFSSA
jgi:hypothetical protein